MTDKTETVLTLPPTEQPQPIVIGDGFNNRLIAVPENYRLSSDLFMEEQQPTPTRKKGRVVIQTVDSFILYVNKHKQLDSILYAQIEKGSSATNPLKIQAVFNEHSPGVYDKTPAGWRDFTAEFIPNVSHEWSTWLKNSGKEMSQVEFATFIENNKKDISSIEGYPTATEMLQMAISFEASQDKTFKSKVRLQSGGMAVEYVDSDDKATATRMTAFEAFAIGIPVFWSGQAYAVDVKLRYKVKDAKLTLWYELQRPDLIVDDAIKETMKDIGEQTEVTVIFGTP